MLKVFQFNASSLNLKIFFYTTEFKLLNSRVLEKEQIWGSIVSQSNDNLI